jgi:carboxyl-terminal processing protease
MKCPHNPLGIVVGIFAKPLVDNKTLMKNFTQFFESAINLCAFVIVTATLLSCATLPGENPRQIEVKNQLERFNEVLSIIQSEFIKPTTIRSLLKAGLIGMYQTEDVAQLKGGAAANKTLSEDSLMNFEDEYYYLTDNNLSPSMLIDNAIFNIADSLGIGSVEYINDEELKELRTGTDHLTAALGVELTKIGNNVVILDTFDKSPAQQFGLLAGDYLLKIDNKPVQNQPVKNVTRWLRGTPGSVVQLTFERDGKVMLATGRREIVKARYVKSALYPKGIGYIRISKFYPSIREQFDQHFAGLVSDNGNELQGIILDLRNNSGGEFHTIIDIAETFLDDGLILGTEGQNIKMEMRFLASKKPNDIGNNLKLIILVNDQTNSGAAMLAAALQDRKRALIIGTKTGSDLSIRSVLPLKTGGALKLKTASMYLPSGVGAEAGVIPNLCLEETNLHEKKTTDPIIQTAINVMLDKDADNGINLVQCSL